MYKMHVSYIQQDLTNLEKMETITSIKVQCNVFLTHHRAILHLISHANHKPPISYLSNSNKSHTTY
jgi:hypothetical protein